MNVRRLAAIDMWGTKGTVRRRRIILAEFIVGVIGALILGGWAYTATSDTTGEVLGLWLIGVGLNYIPLTAYALRLSGSGVLERELDGVDTDRELRRYGVWQFWIFLPLSLVVVTARDELLNRRGR